MIKNKDGGISKQQTERKKEREKGWKKYIDRVPYFANLLYVWAKQVLLHYERAIEQSNAKHLLIYYVSVRVIRWWPML